MTALHETPTDKPILTNIDQFIVWFKAQNFYTNLVFVHGDQLFDFETSENAFRVLAVQTAWCVWQELTASLRSYSRMRIRADALKEQGWHREIRRQQ